MTPPPVPSAPGSPRCWRPAPETSGDASRLNRAASRRSSLRFGRNTLGPVLPVGAPPSRALSAGRLAPTGRTGRSRRSHHVVHRLLAAGEQSCAAFPSQKGWRSGSPAPRPFRSGVSAVLAPRSGNERRCIPTEPPPHREDWPLSALTPLCPRAASSWWRRLRGGDQPESVIALRKSALDAVCLILSITSAIASTASSDASTLRRTTIRCSSPGDSSSSSRRVPL